MGLLSLLGEIRQFRRLRENTKQQTHTRFRARRIFCDIERDCRSETGSPNTLSRRLIIRETVWICQNTVVRNHVSLLLWVPQRGGGDDF